MLFDTLLEDYSPLNKDGEAEGDQGKENSVPEESNAKPKVRSLLISSIKSNFLCILYCQGDDLFRLS